MATEIKRQVMTAILVDGGFYQKRALNMWGKRSPEQRAKELIEYCHRHLKNDFEQRVLYRLFYYDCPPSTKKVFHPLLGKTIDLGRGETYTWTIEFLNQLKKQRKVALRLGKLSENDLCYLLKSDTVKKLCRGSITWDKITEDDFQLNIIQKGVDTRIGLDIASLAYKKLVSQVILISGDSDFVPIAKVARREGIDFILDPMWAQIKDELFEHIDGLKTVCPRPEKSSVEREE